MKATRHNGRAGKHGVVYDNLKVSQIIIEKSPRRKYNIPMTHIGRLGDVKSNGQARNNNFTLS